MMYGAETWAVKKVQENRLVLKCGLAHLNANARDKSNTNARDKSNTNASAQHLNQMQMHLNQMQMHLDKMQM